VARAKAVAAGRFEELNHFVGAEHDRQFARLPRIGNALGDERLAERDAIEEPQRADDLVQGRPGNARRYQMNLEGANVLQLQLSGDLRKYRLNFETALM
jgi:hypothetical protein